MQILQQFADNKINNHPSSFFYNTDYFNNRLCRIKQKIDKLISEIAISNQAHYKKQLTVSSEYQNNNELEKTVQKDTERQNCYSLRTTHKILPEKITIHQKQTVISVYNQIWEFNMICDKDQQNPTTNTAQLRSFKQDIKNQKIRIQRIIPHQMVIQLQNNKKNGYKKSVMKIDTDLKLNEEKEQQNQNKLIAQTFKQVNQKLSKRRIFKQQEKYYVDDSKTCQICQLKCQVI